MEDVVLFIIGFALLFTEVFITPDFGVLGISGIAATRTTAGLIGQGAAGAIGGLCFHWLSRSREHVI